MSTAIDILCFISTCISPDIELLTVKYAFNLETLIYIGKTIGFSAIFIMLRSIKILAQISWLFSIHSFT